MGKSKLILTLLPAACLLALGACGTAASSSETGSSSETPSSTSGEAPSSTSSEAPSSSSSEKKGHPYVTEKTEITFWHTSSYDSDIEKFITAFAELEPNITVTQVKQSTSYDGLKSLVVNGIPANNYPDMFLGYPDAFCEVMNYGKMVDLDPYIENADYGWTEDDLNDVLPNYLEEGRSYPVSGTYSLPFAKSTEAMFYNHDVLVGLDLSGIDSTINEGKPLSETYINNLTWEELFGKLCPAITTYNDALPEAEKILKSDQAYHSIFAYDSDDNLFITLAEQYGYGYTAVDQTTGEGQVLFNNAGMKGLSDTFRAAKDNGYIMTKGSAGGNYTNTYFTAQNCLFTVGSTGGMKYQVSENFDTGIAKIPHAEDQDQYVINQGPSIGILTHNDANRELAAWLFYQFMANEKNSLTWALDSGYSPIRKSVFMTDEYADYSSTEGKETGTLEILQARCAQYVNNVSDDYFVSPVFKGSATCRSEAGGLMTELLTTETYNDTVRDGLFTTAVNNCLKVM